MIYHPEYASNILDWEKYRLDWNGGRDFIDRYLKPFSKRENAEDFKERKDITYASELTSSKIHKLCDIVIQRCAEIVRRDGPESYTKACLGNVDKRGSSMNSYLALDIIPELLNIGKVGVYIDMPTVTTGASLLDTKDVVPYVYTFRAESICNWEFSPNKELISLLLSECYYKRDKVFNLPNGVETRFRLYEKTPSGVTLRFFDQSMSPIDFYNSPSAEVYNLKIRRIPFVIFEINHSLRKGVTDLNIAKLNISSSNVWNSIKGSYHLYTEQFDPASEGGSFKPAVRDVVLTAHENNVTSSIKTSSREIQTGATRGRGYPKGLERPAFINPSSEPLLASMKKIEEMDREVEIILNTTISSLEGKSTIDRASKGLHNIALELQSGEVELANIWCEYVNEKNSVTILYPGDFSLKTDQDRLDEAAKLESLKAIIPSKTFQQETSKSIANTLHKGKVTTEKLDKMLNEIEKAKTLTSDCNEIAKDIESGLVSDATASIARGYEEGEVIQAQKDHAARIARIQAAQVSTAARGVDDLSTDDKGAALEKKQSQMTPDGLKDSNKVRGEA